jgi:hypothetical protein
MSRLPLPVALAGLLAAAAAPLPAQEGVIPLDSNTVAALAALRPRVEGTPRLRFTTPWASSVLVGPRLLPWGLGYDSLAGPAPSLDGTGFMLQVPGRATWTGANVGAVAFGLLGAFVGYHVAGLSCLDAAGCTPPHFEVAVTVGLLAALGGGVVGALVGSQTSQWRTTYRSPDLLRGTDP